MSRRRALIPGADWFTREGPGSPLVISTRARLARNLDGLPYPFSADEDDLEAARGAVLEAVSRHIAEDNEWDIKFAEEMSREDLEMMAEEHVTGASFGDDVKGKAIAALWRESQSITVNQVDHVRIHATLPGAQFMKAWRIADKIDSRLETEVQYSFDRKLGYLTSSPTNVGTGLRVSAMMHLPALVLTGDIAKTMAALAQAGLYARGIFGEGAWVAGNVFLVSNRAALGRTEESIVSMVEAVVGQVADRERTARKVLMREDPLELSDRVSRSLGVVERAKRMCFYEALELVSMVKLGVELDVVPVGDFNMMEVVVNMCPYHINSMLGGEADEDDVERERAVCLRRLLDL